MAHELDITDGQASFANSRSDAWHRLGQSVGHAMTAREALQAAHLAGWNVRKMPLQVPQEPVIDDTGVTTPAPLAVPDFYATVRTNPINGRLDVLGVVGSKYEPVQNEASCDLLDALVDQSGGAHFETAGALRGGRETFVTMKLPSSMVFDGKDGSKDRTDFYLAALNSHDGSSAFRFLVSPIRIVCANTQVRRDRGRQGQLLHPPHRRRAGLHHRSPQRPQAQLALHRSVRSRGRRALRGPDGHRGDAALRQHPARGRLGRHRRHRAPPPRTRQRHRQTVDVLAHRRPHRRHPVGGLQRGHRIP